jgi:hypothetical protein
VLEVETLEVMLLVALVDPEEVQDLQTQISAQVKVGIMEVMVKILLELVDLVNLELLMEVVTIYSYPQEAVVLMRAALILGLAYMVLALQRRQVVILRVKRPAVVVVVVHGPQPLNPEDLV